MATAQALLSSCVFICCDKKKQKTKLNLFYVLKEYLYAFVIQHVYVIHLSIFVLQIFIYKCDI